MVLNYQRWTPPCGCSFEQEVDTDTNEIRLLFTYSVCGNHEDIAKHSKSKSLKAAITKEQVIAKKEDAWQKNHDKNRNDFENHEHIKKIKNKINSRSLTAPSPEDQFLIDYYEENKDKHIQALENFRKERRLEMILGLESEYSLNSQEVYDHIVSHPEEQQQYLEKEG